MSARRFELSDSAGTGSQLGWDLPTLPLARPQVFLERLETYGRAGGLVGRQGHNIGFAISIAGFIGAFRFIAATMRRMSEPALPATKPTHVRFGVLSFACTLSVLTYLDRVCISRVSGDIQRDLGISQVQMGLIFSAFAVGYALFEVPGGWMGDVWGARRVITRIVLWWTVWTALTGCVWPFSWDSGLTLGTDSDAIPVVFNSLMLLWLIRFLFGCGEAGAYPNLTRVVGAWFPFRERAFAQGAIWMSARLGGAIAPFVIGRLAVKLGWRPAFWILGTFGAIWCIFFYTWFRDTPEQSPACNQAERELIRSGLYSFKASEAAHARGRAPWRRILLSTNMWALCLASFCVSFGWYFYVTWQPTYLLEQFNIDYKDSEILTGLPFLCGAFGALLGGQLSDWLIHRTGSRRWGRSLLGVFGFGGAGACVLATGWTTEAWQAVTLLCLAFFINDLAIPAIWAVSTDIGGKFAGTVAGLMNTVGAIAAIISPSLTPILRQKHSWQTVFVVLASAWFLGALAWLRINAAERLVEEQTA